MACVEPQRLQAYFDGEVSAMDCADIEAHATQCSACQTGLDALAQMRHGLRGGFPYPSAPPQLRARIAQMLDAEGGVASPPARWRAPSYWLGALGGFGSAALAFGVIFFFVSLSTRDALLNELTAAHARSLLPQHLIDVESTDRHTVKPWFAGHTDVSPLVVDFAAEGYALLGGRVDFIAHQRAAVVVYRHGPHIINVFTWAGGGRLPLDATRDGYHVTCWKAEDLDYCAVSDTGWDELQGLVRRLRVPRE